MVQRRALWRRAPRYLVLIGASVIAVYPMVWVVMVAFKSQQEYAENALGPPRALDFSNFGAVISNQNVQHWFWNSLLIVIVAVPVLTVISAAAGYSLARLWGRGAGVILVVFLVSEFVPLSIVVVPLFLTIRKLGIDNGVVKLMFVYSSFLMGFAVLVFRGFFKSIPEELREAGRLDGASEYRVFTRIMMPLAKSPVTLVAVIAFLVIWNEYFLAAVLVNSEAHRTVPLGLTEFQSRYGTDWPKIAAALVLSSIPTLVLYGIFQGKIAGSFSRSATRA